MDAYSILQQSHSRAEIRYRLEQFRRARMATSKTEVSHRTRQCPACGSGLKIRTDGHMHTFFACPGCGWCKTVDGALNEAVDMHDAYTPGVTGRKSPQVTVKIDPITKKIKEIRGI